MRRQAPLYPVIAMGTLSCVLGCRQPDEPPLTGTYEIALCKGACSLGDSSRVLFQGHLVLADTTLTIAQLPEAKRPYLEVVSAFMDVEGPLNGCFTFQPVRATRREIHGLPFLLVPGARTSLDPASLTHWDRRAEDTVEFTLYRSPDANHRVVAHIASGRLVGQAAWSAVGVAPDEREGDIGADFVIGRRIGAADIERCIREAPELSHSPQGSSTAPQN